MSASPATAVQVAHACQARGFDLAVPASWGDELVASETLRRLAETVRGPAVACVCPFARARLQATGADLSAFALDLVPPPVALARYLRVIYGANGVRLTYIGTCPAASDSSIDAHITPMEFFAELADRGISLVDQPRIFESVVPPDRRRWSSLPGGIPTPERLWSEGGARVLVELDGRDVAAAVAEHLVAPERVLLDVAPALGCACSGVVDGVAPRDARAALMELEPPRSPTSVVDPGVSIGFDPPPLRPPRASDDRPSVAGTAAPASPPEISRSARQTLAATSGYWHMPTSFDRPMSHDARTVSGAEGIGPHFDAPIDRPALRRKLAVRHAGGSVPRARRADGDARALPRAYVAHRKFVLGLRLEPEVETMHEAGDALERERAIDRSVEPDSARAPHSDASVSEVVASALPTPATSIEMEAPGSPAAESAPEVEAPGSPAAESAPVDLASASASHDATAHPLSATGSVSSTIDHEAPAARASTSSARMRVPPPPPRAESAHSPGDRIRRDDRPMRAHAITTASREPHTSSVGTVLAVLTVVALLALAGFVAVSLLRVP